MEIYYPESWHIIMYLYTNIYLGSALSDGSIVKNAAPLSYPLLYEPWRAEFEHDPTQDPRLLGIDEMNLGYENNVPRSANRFRVIDILSGRNG